MYPESLKVNSEIIKLFVVIMVLTLVIHTVRLGLDNTVECFDRFMLNYFLVRASSFRAYEIKLYLWV